MVKFQGPYKEYILHLHNHLSAFLELQSRAPTVAASTTLQEHLLIDDVAKYFHGDLKN